MRCGSVRLRVHGDAGGVSLSGRSPAAVSRCGAGGCTIYRYGHDQSDDDCYYGQRSDYRPGIFSRLVSEAAGSFFSDGDDIAPGRPDDSVVIPGTADGATGGIVYSQTAGRRRTHRTRGGTRTNEPLDQRLQLVISKAQVREIDEWRRREPDLSSRSEAIRRLIAIGLMKEMMGGKDA